MDDTSLGDIFLKASLAKWQGTQRRQQGFLFGAGNEVGQIQQAMGQRRVVFEQSCLSRVFHRMVTSAAVKLPMWPSQDRRSSARTAPRAVRSLARRTRTR